MKEGDGAARVPFLLLNPSRSHLLPLAVSPSVRPSPSSSSMDRFMPLKAFVRVRPLPRPRSSSQPVPPFLFWRHEIEKSRSFFVSMDAMHLSLSALSKHGPWNVFARNRKCVRRLSRPLRKDGRRDGRGPGEGLGTMAGRLKTRGEAGRWCN